MPRSPDQCGGQMIDVWLCVWRWRCVRGGVVDHYEDGWAGGRGWGGWVGAAGVVGSGVGGGGLCE